MSFQITLRAARVNVGLTQTEAGEAVGVNLQTIRGWENGDHTIPAHKFIELCKVYGVSPDFILLPSMSTLSERE